MAVWRWCSRGAWVGLWMALALGGCDDGPTTTPPPRPDGGPAPDTHVPGDPDAGTTDASQDATAPGGDDAGSAACTFAAEDLRSLPEQNLDLDEPPALAVRNDGLLFAWVELAHPQAPTPLAVQRWTLELEMPLPVTVTEQVSEQRDPVAVATAEGFLLVWRDDRAGSFDLLARAVDANGDVAEGAPVSVTNGGGDDGPPAAARKGDHVLVAWVRGGQGYTRLLDAEGSPLADAREVDGLGASVGRPALAAIENGFALAWVDADGHVPLLPLDAEGRAVGTPVEADAEGNAVGPVSAASTGGDRGGLVFDARVAGDRAEVKFRAFDGSASPLFAEEGVTVSGERGQASALAPLLGGYATAYRGTLDDEEGEALRFALLDDGGRRVQPPIPLEDTSPPPTFTALGAAPDGRTVIAAWTDATGRYLARLRCE